MRALARHVPGVALVLQALEQPVELGGEVRLDEHLVAAHVDDVVDVLDVDRALLDAGAAGHAGPEHVGVDDARAAVGHVEPVVAGGRRPAGARPRLASVGSSSSSASRLSSSARRYGALANAWSRRAMIISLGDSGFSVFHAGHWSWQRPHSVQVAKSSMPFQEKSSTEPTPSLVSSSRSSMSSRVSGLAVAHQRLGGTERDRRRRPNRTLSGARKMWRCLEFSTMIRNTSMTPMWSSRPMPSRTSSASCAEAVEQVADAWETNAPLP